MVPVFLLVAACSAPIQDQQQSSVDSLFTAAEEVYYAGQYDSATTILTPLSQNSSPSIQTRALTWLGLVQWRLGDYSAARELGEQALALKLEHGLDDQLLRSYNALGLLAWNESRLGAASQLFQQAVEAAGDDRRGAAVATGNLALVQTEYGQFEAARAGFLVMQQSMSELGDARAEGNALTNLGMIELRLGNPAAAVEWLTRAYDLNQSIPYPLGVQAALGQMGAAYTELGEPERAFSVLDQALTEARQQGLRREEAAMLETLAELYRGLGDYRRASLLYDQATAINTQLGLDYETGVDYRGMADMQRELGNIDRARDLAISALEIHHSQGILADEFSDLLLLAQLSKPPWEYLGQACELRDQLNTRAARMDYALTATDLMLEAGRFEQAEALIHEIEPALEYSGTLSLWKAQLLHSQVHANAGPPDHAIELAYEALEAMRRAQVIALSGVRSKEQQRTVSHLIGLLLGEGQVEAAFAVSDNAPGRNTLRTQAAPDSTVRAMRDRTSTRLREIDQLVESIDLAEEYGENPSDLRARLDTLRTEYEELWLRFRAAGRVTPADGFDLRAIQGLLRPNELLLEYSVGNDSLLTFALTASRLEAFVAEIPYSSLMGRVRLTWERLSDPTVDPERVQPALSGLWDLLLRPVAEAGLLTPNTSLIVVPHDVLNYLPFAALHGETGYLVETHALRYLPSGSLLPGIGVRNPSTNSTVEVFAPFPAQLPASLQEIRSIDAGRYIGRRATEWRLRRALGRSEVVHVATHGVMNFHNPLFSHLDLSPGTGVSADNGRFEVHELLNMSVRASLVFLSGCETGMGRAHTTHFAEGGRHETLAQAFLHAGARNVLATLWKVEDVGASVLAEQFYDTLALASPADALAAVQRSLLRHDQYRHPYYWAAYQLSGVN